jgi:hypothetical protein
MELSSSFTVPERREIRGRSSRGRLCRGADAVKVGAGRSGSVAGYFEIPLGPSTTNSSSGSGSGMAIAPERRCGFGFGGAGTGASGSPRPGGSLLGFPISRVASLACCLFFLILRLRLSRPFPTNAYAAPSPSAVRLTPREQPNTGSIPEGHALIRICSAYRGGRIPATAIMRPVTVLSAR